MILRLLLFLVVLTAVSLAETRNPIPDPALLLEADSYSIAVMELREDDDAVKKLLEATLNSIATGESKLPASMADVSDYLSRNNRADLLFAGLPFQAVRVDRMLPNGQTSPLYAFTLAGWRGLQVNLYNSLAAGPGGKAYPSENYRRTDLVFRDHSDDPTWAGTLCRPNGTFLFAPSAAQAKQTVDRLMPKDKPVPPVAGALLTAYQALPKTPDAYGILINQKDAFSALLKSMNNDQIQKVRDKVGSDRLDKVVANTKKVVWQVNLTPDDKAQLSAVLTMDPKEIADAKSMLEEGRTNLDATKVTDVTITPAADSITVSATVVGLKQMLIDGLAKSGK